MMTTRQHTRTIAEVEQGGKWVSIRNNPHGFAPELLHSWRRSCPYVRSRKLKEMMATVYVDGEQKPMPTVFFLRRQLAKVAALYQRGESRYRKRARQHSKDFWRERWAALKEFIDDKGAKWVRTGTTCTILGVGYSTLKHWNERGCAFLDGAAPQTQKKPVGKLDLTYYLADEVLDLKKKIDGLRPEPCSGLLTKKQIIEKARISERTLVRHVKNYHAVKTEILVRGKNGNRHYETALPAVILERLIRQTSARRARSLKNLELGRAALREKWRKTGRPEPMASAASNTTAADKREPLRQLVVVDELTENALGQLGLLTPGPDLKGKLRTIYDVMRIRNTIDLNDFILSVWGIDNTTNGNVRTWLSRFNDEDAATGFQLTLEGKRIKKIR